METFPITRGDTRPALRYILPSEVNLENVTAVSFSMRGILKDAPAEVSTLVPPTLQYVWKAGDTDVLGDFRSTFTITYGDNSKATFPSTKDPHESLVVQVVEDVL